MSELELGFVPKSGSLNLVQDSDFALELITKDGSTWPLTAQAVIKVGSQSWTSTVSGSKLIFSVDKIEVNQALNESPETFELHYVNGSTELTWMKGQVETYA